MPKQPYGGFPLELLDSNNENLGPNYSSKTMPRLMGTRDDESVGDSSGRAILSREESFHDDRAHLSSQRDGIGEQILNGANRRSSLWY